MSHPLVSEGFHYHGFPLQGAKAIYVRTIIDPSVVHVQALGEAIRRWNLRDAKQPSRDAVLEEAANTCLDRFPYGLQITEMTGDREKFMTYIAERCVEAIRALKAQPVGATNIQPHALPPNILTP